MSSIGEVAVDRDEREENTIVAIESDHCSATLFIEPGADAQEVAGLLEDAGFEASWYVPGDVDR